ncbi:MAG: hypothetical protein JO240_00140 [Solirubrobacterales bacterium]|nr:hypothetical protein [Solirubrobacterales bacterium]
MSAVETAEIVGAAVAVITLAGPVQNLFRRTLGRKWDLYERLYRLGAGAQLNFFIAVIGEPPALGDTVEVDMPDSGAAGAPDGDPSVKRRFLRSTFVDPLFYLVTISDEDEAVLGFSITTRRRRFAPTFYAPRAPSFRRRIAGRLPFGRQSYWLVRFRLGRTNFARAASNLEGTPRIQSSSGARVWLDSEAWYLGSRGHDLTYVFTNTSASPVGGLPEGLEPVPEWEDQEAAIQTDSNCECTFKPWVAAIRTTTQIDTVTVVSSPLQLERWPGAFGPHDDEVRQLP